MRACACWFLICAICRNTCSHADVLYDPLPDFDHVQVGLNDINTVTKICEEGCDVHFTTTVFPALTIAANRGSSDMVIGTRAHTYIRTHTRPDDG